MNEAQGQRSGVQVAARMVFTPGHRVRNVASHSLHGSDGAHTQVAPPSSECKRERFH